MPQRFLRPVAGYLVTAGVPIVLITAFEPAWVFNLLGENVLRLPALETIRAVGEKVGKLQNYPLAIIAYTYALVIALPFALYTASKSKRWAALHWRDFIVVQSASSSAQSNRILGRGSLFFAAVLLWWVIANAGLDTEGRPRLFLSHNGILEDKWFTVRPVIIMTIAMFLYAMGVHSLRMSRLFSDAASAEQIKRDLPSAANE